MIRSRHHIKKPMNHTIRIRISRRRWTPEDIEAGDADDPGECWEELFEDEEEAAAYLWRRLGCTLTDLRAQAAAGPYCADAALTYSDAGDTRETIKHGGTIEWTATIIGGAV